MKSAKKHIIIILIVGLSLVKCTEPYKLETITFEEVLVVESILTNKLKHQVVKLNRAIQIETDQADVVSNAQVWVEGGTSTYVFTESETGIYLSEEVFKAQADVSYQLHIITSDGKEYQSREEYLTPEAEIENLYAEEETINGKHGIQIYVDSNEDVGDAKYFRYEYEETHKVITPHFVDFDVDIENINPISQSLSFDIVVTTPSEENKRICYTTNHQTNIIQTNLSNSSVNKINKMPIRFLQQDDYKIRNRYSILVKQYVQSFESYNYYKILGELGNNENLLVENQPGFVAGNMVSKNNANDKVIGFFEVATVTKKRLFFNYYDFNLEAPDYPYWCDIDTLDYRDNTTLDYDPDDRAILYNKFVLETPTWELLKIVYETDWEGNQIPIYHLLKPECGNCTTHGLNTTNIKPEFWED